MVALLALLICFPLLAADAPHPLLVAAAQANVSQVRELLLQGVDPDYRAPDGESALSLAVWSGSLEIVRTLLDSNANPNMDAADGPVLLRAIAYGHVDIARTLVEKGARIEPADENGIPALVSAAAAGNEEIVRLLLDAGAEVNARVKPRQTPSASTHRFTNAISALPLNGDTALALAVREGYFEIVQLLIGRGADPDTEPQRGALLIDAANEGQTSIVEELLRKGANATGRDEQARTALMIAVERGDIEMAKALIAGGSEVNAQRYDEQTPLCVAISDGRMDLTELLLAYGADTSTPIESGTLLHEAVSAGKEEVAEALLRNRADVNAKDSDGRTPLAIARNAAHGRMMEILLKAGARE